MSDLEGPETLNMGSSSLDSALCNEISSDYTLFGGGCLGFAQWCGGFRFCTVQLERFGFCTVQWERFRFCTAEWKRFRFCTVQWVREVWILHCAVMDLDLTLCWEPFEEVSANTTELIPSNAQFVFYNSQSFSSSRTVEYFLTSHHGQELLRCQCVQVNYLREICICLNYRGKGTLYFYRTILSTILRLLQKIVPELL